MDDGTSAIGLYEIKFLVDPRTVFDPAAAPLVDIRLPNNGVVGSSPQLRRMDVAFVDSPEQELRGRGWTVRLRNDCDEDTLKVSYKRRYPLAESDDVGAAVAQARADFPQGFGSGRLELDWGPARRTLSVGFVGHEGPPRSDGEDAISVLPAALAPDRALIKAGKRFGPAPAVRWKARNDEVKQKLELELWRLPSTSGQFVDVVEIGFEEERFDDAVAARDRLIALLKAEGWGLAPEALKTDLLFRAFSPSP
jgi:hypothetical protein